MAFISETEETRQSFATEYNTEVIVRKQAIQILIVCMCILASANGVSAETTSTVSAFGGTTFGVEMPDGPKGFTTLPAQAPRISLPDTNGNIHSTVSKNEWTLLVFNLGLSCPHCAEQILRLSRWRERFTQIGVRIIAIAPEINKGQYRQFRIYGDLRVTLVVDANRKAFASYGCVQNDDLLHGLFLVSPQGKVQWQQVTNTADMKIEPIFHLVKTIKK